MSKSIRVITKKRRGRPVTTGKGTLVGVRLQPDDLTELDDWISEQDESFTRPEAIRRLVELGLAGIAKPRAKPSEKIAAKAKEQAIDRLVDPAAPAEEKASRKRRLLKGPEEFQELRVDRANKKFTGL
jgi:hypothetical protein